MPKQNYNRFTNMTDTQLINYFDDIFKGVDLNVYSLLTLHALSCTDENGCPVWVLDGHTVRKTTANKWHIQLDTKRNTKRNTTLSPLTTLNEFETIPAYTHIAGDSLGTWSPRDIVTAMVMLLQSASSYDCRQLWQDIATTYDDEQYLIDVQSDIAQTIQDNCPLADYCTVELHDSEWRVVPYIDDDLQRLNFFPDTTSPFESDYMVQYDILVVNDHGNVDLMQWDHNKREYTLTWSMV